MHLFNTTGCMHLGLVTLTGCIIDTVLTPVGFPQCISLTLLFTSESVSSHVCTNKSIHYN